MLRAVAKHSAALAQAVVDSRALEELVLCLEDFDPQVKEGASWALGYIARHNSELAQAVVDAGAVPSLVQAVQEPELSLKRIASSALADIAKHTPDLAQAVVDSGAIAFLAPLIHNADARLKRQVLSCLAQVAKHSVDLAELVVEGEIFPRVLRCLRDVDSVVQKNSAILVREIAKHTPMLAQLITNAGGVAATVDFVTETSGNARLPGVMTLGYIAAFSESLAMAVIADKGVPAIAAALGTETEDHVKAACVWALGSIGRHTPDHAKALADNNVYPKLLAAHGDEHASEDLRNKAKRALKITLAKCVHLPALDPLLHAAPPNVLKYVVAQYAKVLPHDVASRRDFVTSGGLQRIQSIDAEPGSELRAHIDAINSCYPEDVVRYYSPGYSQVLLDKVDAYHNNVAA